MFSHLLTVLNFFMCTCTYSTVLYCTVIPSYSYRNRLVLPYMGIPYAPPFGEIEQYLITYSLHISDMTSEEHKHSRRVSVLGHGLSKCYQAIYHSYPLYQYHKPCAKGFITARPSCHFDIQHSHSTLGLPCGIWKCLCWCDIIRSLKHDRVLSYPSAT